MKGGRAIPYVALQCSTPALLFKTLIPSPSLHLIDLICPSSDGDEWRHLLICRIQNPDTPPTESSVPFNKKSSCLPPDGHQLFVLLSPGYENSHRWRIPDPRNYVLNQYSNGCGIMSNVLRAPHQRVISGKLRTLYSPSLDLRNAASKGFPGIALNWRPRKICLMAECPTNQHFESPSLWF